MCLKRVQSLTLRPAAGWVVLHRGADTGACLLAYTWMWDNAVQVHIAVAGQPALDCPDDDPTHFVELGRREVGCVWELAVLEHERAAWVRHLLTPDDPDLAGYLRDARAEGPVGPWVSPGPRSGSSTRWASSGRSTG
ncbi:hypothetical protein ACN263_12240 [Micromonospora sp. WMMD729]|uniref:hypothetical protein n=1 Tax=Micromonospora sp. WMMD729 TaxID=3404127 RepID=UPI003BF61504